MLKEMNDDMRAAVLMAAQGSELIANATGERVAEVLERNLLRKPVQSEPGKVLPMRTAGGVA